MTWRGGGLLCLLALPSFGQQVGETLPTWSAGTLDIHQIHTGRGNAALLIFPDGKTMLIDAGMVPERAGPELGPRRPNASRRAGEWIARYIRQFSPRAELDYALITHYHGLLGTRPIRTTVSSDGC